MFHAFIERESMKRKKLIDLSLTIENTSPVIPPIMIPTINYKDHRAGVEAMQTSLPGITQKVLPKGLGKAVKLAEAFNRGVATPDEARRILGLKGKDGANF